MNMIGEKNMKGLMGKYEKLLEREKKVKFICAELNNFVDLKQTLITVVNNIKVLTNCEALSIRLHHDGDYPYYTYNGFPESFIEKENSLCVKDKNGDRIPSSDGKGFLLDCMCGNIINGKFDSSLPFFTKKGSFWSNNTTVLLASTTEEDLQSGTRNYCNSCGYESVALIPIKIKDKRIGLIQLNDMRTGMFSEDLIEYIEMIGEQIGLAVDNAYQYQQILDQKNQLDITLNELDAANKELEAFSYSVSHDLRAPLRAIDGFSKIFLEDYTDKLDDEGKRVLNVIRSNTNKMGTLIDDILEFSRIGRKEMRMSDINMEGLAENVFKELKLTTPNRKLKFNIKSLLSAFADYSMIRIVLVNLISNAVKFTKTQEIPIIEIGSHEEDGENVYYVKDNGSGFDMKYVYKLFGVFQRLHSSEEFEGTGVGLALVKRIIDKHGGRVWADGEVNEGATFYFTLPKIGGKNG